MDIFKNLGNKKIIIGLIHLKPLPGTPYYKEDSFEEILEKALADAKALYRGGADGCLIQTVDRIYPAGDDADYARVSAMSVITHEVRKATSPEFHVGVQIMWNCISPSLAVAKVCGAVFTRATALAGTTTSPFGIVNANPLKIANYRKLIGADSVAIIAEISGYHNKGFGDDQPIPMKARMAMNVGANAVEIMANDEETNNRLVHDIKKALPHVPVILGGGTDIENVKRRLKEANGALVGSCFENKNWGGNVDESIVSEYMAIVRSMENK
jgi:membrane complex biogenesis BtpA family protein